MSFPKDDSELEQALADTFGPPPAADFDAWQQQHPDAIASLDAQRISTLATRSRTRTRRTVVFATSAAILVCAWLGVSYFPTNSPGNGAFAQALEQIEKAKTITWKEIRYAYFRHKGGKGIWVRAEEEHAYRSPGVYREVSTTLGEKDAIPFIRITDEVQKKELMLWPKRKKADLEEVAVQTHCPEGPFVYASEKIKKGNLQWVGKRKTLAGEVNVFRSSDDSCGRHWSVDLWIDPKTRQFVGEQIPGTDIYDPEKDPEHNNPIGEKWPNGSPICVIIHDIVFDADLDESLFRLEPPEGYTVHIQRRNYVTEREMINYIGILAEVNDKTFPRQTYPNQLSLSLSRSREEDIDRKAEKDRTAAERRYVEVIGRYVRANLNHMPIYHFITDNAVKDSFRYFGKGVRLGDKYAIVCWYKLKDAKDPNTYRVVYGDLSVKDVSAEDLPLPVDP